MVINICLLADHYKLISRKIKDNISINSSQNKMNIKMNQSL